MEIKLTVNTQNFEKKLQGFADKAADMKAIVPIINEEIREDLILRFKSSPSTTTGGEVYGGQQWQELSEGYLRTHPKRQSGQIYIDTGAFRDAMTTTGEVKLSGDGEFTFEVNAPNAEKLQKARPVLFWHNDLIKKITDKIRNRLK